eukprot:m.115235 g.115235  ORF g.115235 m.115235 type:complete len:108 (+) comp9287_c1_seq1:40-363(+)
MKCGRCNVGVLFITINDMTRIGVLVGCCFMLLFLSSSSPYSQYTAPPLFPLFLNFYFYLILFVLFSPLFSFIVFHFFIQKHFHRPNPQFNFTPTNYTSLMDMIDLQL